jgi:chorismate mutase
VTSVISQLVLNLLRGLNSRYNTADDIANEKGGFPSFTEARDMLTLKKLRLANETKVANSTALLAGAGRGGPRNWDMGIQNFR